MFACKNCSTVVKSIVGGECQQCCIGSKNPTIWAFESLQAAIAKKIELNPSKGAWHTEASVSLHYHIDGHYVVNKIYSNNEAKNIVVIHPTISCVVDSYTKNVSNIRLKFSRWTDDGMTTFRNNEKSQVSIPIKDINSLVEEGIPHYLEALADLIKHARTGFYICSNCEKQIENNHLRHFAGIYCVSCWKQHQKENSGTCGLCRRPYYECCC